MKVTSKAGTPTYSITDMTEEQAIAVALLLGRSNGDIGTAVYEVYSKLDDELVTYGWTQKDRLAKYNLTW